MQRVCGAAQAITPAGCNGPAGADSAVWGQSPYVLGVVGEPPSGTRGGTTMGHHAAPAHEGPSAGAGYHRVPGRLGLDGTGRQAGWMKLAGTRGRIASGTAGSAARTRMRRASNCSCSAGESTPSERGGTVRISRAWART